MPLLTELDLVWGLELQRCRAYGAEKCRSKGAKWGAHPPRVRFDAPRVEQAADAASAATREGACAPQKISREGCEGGEGFFMDKIFDSNKINL